MVKRGKDNGFLGKGLFSLGKIFFKKIVDNSFEKMEERAMEMKRRIMKAALASILVGLGALTLIFSLYVYLVEDLNFSKTYVSLFFGLILLLAGFFLKYLVQKERGKRR